MVKTRSGKVTHRRVEWTNKMIEDLLNCKRKALIATSSSKPPTKNGRRVGYIAYMYELWLSLGYENLVKTPHSLCNRANQVQKKLSKQDHYYIITFLLSHNGTQLMLIQGYDSIWPKAQNLKHLYLYCFSLFVFFNFSILTSGVLLSWIHSVLQIWYITRSYRYLLRPRFTYHFSLFKQASLDNLTTILH